MNHLTSRLALACLALTGAACSSDPHADVSAGDREITVRALSADVESPELALTTAWLSLQTLSLVPCAADAAPLHTDKLAVDLLGDTSAGVTFESAVTDYCRIELELAPWTAPYPEALVGSSVLLRGTLDEDKPFGLTSTLGTRFSFTNADGPFGAGRLVLGVDFRAWFADSELAEATVDDETALVDEEQHADVLAEFEGSTPLAVSLYLDADSDHALTPEELVPIATAVPE